MALSRHHGATMRPMSTEEISRQAQDFEFGAYRPLKSWLRSAQLLLTEARSCEQDGDLQKAYLYLLRHAELVVGKLPEHPEYKDPRFKDDINQAILTVQKNFQKLEQWKPKIVQQYERYLKAMERRNAEKERVQQERLLDERQRLAEEEVRRGSLGSEDGAFDDRDQSLNASDNRQLAVDLAHREIRRRDASKQSTRQAGISPSTVAARRRGIVVDDREQRTSYELEGTGLGSVGDGVREAGRLLQHPSQRQPRQSVTQPQRASSAAYQYPSVPAKEQTMDWKMAPLPLVPSAASREPPSLPSKEAVDQTSHLGPPIPPRPRASNPPTPPTATPSPPPNSHRTSKYTFKPTAFTERGNPLRPVLLPPELRTSFLNLAHANTFQNLETCGILCGTLISNALFITHLILPDQHSTSDTCDTTEAGDNALFDYCDAHSLLVCGWIHTHPSQSCFLSSRDLHTSSGYQVMLPEAIAIVCAPRHNPDWGIFRLTDPPGLQHVLKCERKGLFHPHEEENLYTDAVRPGHVVEGPGLRFEVVDMRQT